MGAQRQWDEYWMRTVVMNGEHGMVWTTKFRGFSKVNRDKKRGQFRVDQDLTSRYSDKESTDTRIGLMYRMARYKMILKRMVIFCHGDWCLSMKVHSYQTHNTFEIHFTTFLPFFANFCHSLPSWMMPNHLTQNVGHLLSRRPSEKRLKSLKAGNHCVFLLANEMAEF